MRPIANTIAAAFICSLLLLGDIQAAHAYVDLQ
jgi:hypothetical protein